MFGREVNQRAVSQAVVLHEHQVPNFNDFRIVFIDKVTAVYLFAGFLVAYVNVDFGARSTRARLTHLPEIVFL